MRNHRDISWPARSTLSLALLASALLGFHASRVEAQTPAPICAPIDSIDRFRLLRQISLDLLGRIPTEAEYAMVRSADDVEDAVVDTLMESEEFYEVLRRYHRSLVWGSLADVTAMVNGRRRISLQAIGDNQVWWAPLAGTLYRGDNVSCVDIEHTRFDADGHPVPLVTGYRSGTVNGAPAPRNAARCTDGAGCQIEGWVWVNPYWAPSTRVRVCAFDAQAISTGIPAANGTEVECTPNMVSNAGCGCGPNLRFCLTPETDTQVREALVDEPLRIFESVIREGRDYFDALTTTDTYMNGPAAHYYRFTTAGVTFDTQHESIPDLAWNEGEWTKVARTEMHSGVLTTLLYNMRFASHRARANRYFTAFMCQPFEAPSEGLPSSTDPCSSDPNLSTRCGCATCHERLEPAAAHWGRWRFNNQYGWQSASQLPLVNRSCATCAEGRCSNACNLNYVTADNATNDAEHEMWGGTLTVAAWRTEAEQAVIDVGPRALVQREGTMDGLERCAARTIAERLLGRELTAEEGLDWLPSIVSDFAASGHDFKSLIRSIVRDARYRAIR